MSCVIEQTQGHPSPLYQYKISDLWQVSSHHTWQWFTVPEATVHFWLASFDVPDAALYRYQVLLNQSENKKAKSFVFEHDRKAFIVARGLLRRLLSCYTGESADAIQFFYNRYGKPSLRQHDGASPLHFNLSHTKQYVVYAITSCGPVGVDLEAYRTDVDILSIADRFFCVEEFRQLSHISQMSLQKQAFYHLWTAKEALIKALGRGMGDVLKRLLFHHNGEAYWSLSRLNDSEQQAREWRVSPLELACPGHCATYAVAAHVIHQKMTWLSEG